MEKVFHPIAFLSVGLGLFVVGLLSAGKAINLQDMAFAVLLSAVAAAFIIGAAILKSGR